MAMIYVNGWIATFKIVYDLFKDYRLLYIEATEPIVFILFKRPLDTGELADPMS